MSRNPEQPDTIEQLAYHEELVSELYKAYARKFPDYRQFWSELADDEIKHAGWIRALRSKTEKGTRITGNDRFRMVPIPLSLRYVGNQLAHAQKEEMALIKALSIALDIEKSMVEKKFFEVLEGDSSELRDVLAALADQTRKHFEELQKAWAEERRPPA